MAQSKLKVTLWTSSHGTSDHHFPQSMRKTFKENEFINYPVINAKRGGTFRPEFLEQYERNFEQIQKQNKPQLNVILLGDNNLRMQAFRGGLEILKHATKLVELHKNSIHPLLFFGLLPSPISHYSTFQLARFSDDKVEELFLNTHRSDPKNSKLFTFVRSDRFFMDANGSVLSDMFFEKDKTHLNKEGALVLAQEIYGWSLRVAENYFKM